MWRIKDRPALVTGGLIIIAVLYTFAAWLWPAVDFFALLRAPPERLDSVVSLYLGVAGVAAVGAGFAGVVIVFGLDTQSEKFLDFRSDGREPPDAQLDVGDRIVHRVRCACCRSGAVGSARVRASRYGDVRPCGPPDCTRPSAHAVVASRADASRGCR